VVTAPPSLTTTISTKTTGRVVGTTRSVLPSVLQGLGFRGS
jgi:hypothetical protein